MKDSCGNEITSSSEKAGLLNDFFAKVLTVEGQGQLPHINHSIPEEESIQTVFFSPEDVWKSITSCKDSLSCGPDNIPSRIFKIAGDILAYPLSMIYNVSMSTGVVPDDWKEANITAIFKKGSRTSPSNYRPISLTSVACRIMERGIKAKLMYHLEKHNILTEAQHGFQKKKSTLTNLLQYMEAITDAVDKGLQVDAVYFDFRKAFDKVPHRRLLAKLEAVGIKGLLLNWLKSWLTGRKQRVCVDQEFSDWTDTTSSVAQGSVLGPILFLIYINDLQSVVKSDLSMFADDTKAFRVIKDKSSDRLILQEDINAMLQWSKDWLMEFNIEKCSTITFGHGQQNMYTLADTQLESVNCQRDVGIQIPSNLKFEEQCAAVISKANSVLGQIRRAFNTRDKSILLNAYQSYVLPHLDYCCQIWSPGTQKWIHKVEQVQKRALRLIPSLNGRSYEQKLASLKLLSLENRRVMFDLTQKYKEESSKENAISPVKSTRQTRSRTDKKLEKPRFRLDIRKNSFNVRTIDNWNKLPVEIRESKSLGTFKTNVKTYLLTKQLNHL